MMFARLIGDNTAASPQSATDQCALTTTHKAAQNGSAGSRATDDLRAGVMLMIAGLLGRDRPPVTPLRRSFLAGGSERQGKN